MTSPRINSSARLSFAVAAGFRYQSSFRQLESPMQGCRTDAWGRQHSQTSNTEPLLDRTRSVGEDRERQWNPGATFRYDEQARRRLLEPGELTKERPVVLGQRIKHETVSK